MLNIHFIPGFLCRSLCASLLKASVGKKIEKVFNLQIPALQELTQAGIRLLLNGDTSQWDRAMQMPHYNPTSMPAMSLHTGIHIVQVTLTICVEGEKLFRLFSEQIGAS